MGKDKSQMELRTITIDDLEYREDEDKPIVSGYVTRFNKLSEEMWGFREQVAPGAFTKSLGERKVLSFWNHNSDIVLGNTENDTLKLEEDEKGLRFELTLPDTTAGKDARTLIKRGDVKGMSFGFRTVKDQWDESDPKRVIRTLLEVKLYEVSPTPMPAYPQSSVAARSMEDMKESYEEYLKSKKEDSELQRRFYDMKIKNTFERRCK
jgi:HK97 family phage prohead protease